MQHIIIDRTMCTPGTYFLRNCINTFVMSIFSNFGFLKQKLGYTFIFVLNRTRNYRRESKSIFMLSKIICYSNFTLKIPVFVAQMFVLMNTLSSCTVSLSLVPYILSKVNCCQIKKIAHQHNLKHFWLQLFFKITWTLWPVKTLLLSKEEGHIDNLLCGVYSFVKSSQRTSWII